MVSAEMQTAAYGIFATNITVNQNTQKPSDKAGNFEDVMNTKKDSFKVKEKPPTDNQVTSKTDNLKNEMKKSSEIAKKMKELDKANAEASTAGAAMVTQDVALENVQEVVSDMKDSISKSLGISLEDVNELMNTLELTDLDLLDKDSLSQLVMENANLNGVEELLTNDEASNAYKEIMNVLQELENGGDFQPVENNVVTEISYEPVESNNEQLVDIQVEIEDKGVNTSELKVADKEVQDTEETQTKVEGELTEVVTTSNTQQTNSSSENNTKNENKDTKSNEDISSIASNVLNNKLDVVDNIKELLMDRVGESRADSILSQVLDQIKLNVKSDLTSMEMQLYPEHLGKVGIQVTSKDGSIIAQITAESQAAKEALESQVITLRENLNNQGVKVEAVEVTIASHSFEQNNMQDSHKDDEQSGNRKRVSKSLLGEINGDMFLKEMEENDVAEAMGGTVSYLA